MIQFEPIFVLNGFCLIILGEIICTPGPNGLAAVTLLLMDQGSIYRGQLRVIVMFFGVFLRSIHCGHTRLITILLGAVLDQLTVAIRD